MTLGQMLWAILPPLVELPLQLSPVERPTPLVELPPVERPTPSISITSPSSFVFAMNPRRFPTEFNPQVADQIFTQINFTPQTVSGLETLQSPLSFDLIRNVGGSSKSPFMTRTGTIGDEEITLRYFYESTPNQVKHTVILQLKDGKEIKVYEKTDSANSQPFIDLQLKEGKLILEPAKPNELPIEIDIKQIILDQLMSENLDDLSKFNYFQAVLIPALFTLTRPIDKKQKIVRAEVRGKEGRELFVELIDIFSSKEPIALDRIQRIASFVRAEVRQVGLKSFARSLRKAALRQIEEKSTRVDQTNIDQWMVEAIKFLSGHQTKVLSRKGKIDPNLTLGFYFNDNDEPLTAESFIKAAFAEGVPNGLSRLIAVGNPEALRPIQKFTKEIKQSHMILTMIRNPDGIKGYGVSVPVLRKDLAEPSSNPEVVYVGVDSTAVKRESWNPILEVGESYSQLVAAIMLLRKKQNLAAVPHSELRALLKETSIQLFPRLKGEILKWQIEDNPRGGLRLSIHIDRSGFMDYIERLANELKARSEVLIAA